MCVALELFQAPLLSKKHKVKDNDVAFSQEGYFLEMLRKEHCIFPIKSCLPFKPQVNVKLIKCPQGKKLQLHWVMLQENKMDFRLLLHCSLMEGGIQRGLNSPPCFPNEEAEARKAVTCPRSSCNTASQASGPTASHHTGVS